ncbi:Aspartate--tRNA(Asp/Asn) ligase [Lachnellula willkommii]|uniref:Aspartate--tRNA(Asp/Asn) ligase n=1 Tax=Lachnellula willkommii TaxID=215461 RepID=A0A559M335_9HELO|nr:Aspartate--tRNA(Asp/Asn) ligase [Lachnellula willkommii]
MTIILRAARHIITRNTRAAVYASPWRGAVIPLVSSWPPSRGFHVGYRLAKEEKWGRRLEEQEKVEKQEEVVAEALEPQSFWDEFKGTSFVNLSLDNVPPPTFPFEKRIPSHFMALRITTVGFLTKIVRLSDALTFAHINRGTGPEVLQLLSKNKETTKKLQSMRLNSAISVTGVIHKKYKPKVASKRQEREFEEGWFYLEELELEIEEITCLNTFDKDIGYGPEHVYRPENRHLQIRFDTKLQHALLFRSDVAACAREELKDFYEIETPILFKSTPEGAREFLVPTRKPGFAYALPQSPQQYKQMLMASGIHKYMQFAKCFRDEDLRADRQPEFTQIDLEMAWADGEIVMARVEKLIRALYKKFAAPDTPLQPLFETSFHRITYDEAMSHHGSDKPDLRIPGLIQRIDHIVPHQLGKMLTHLENPIFEACKIRLNGHPERIKKFVSMFFSTPVGEIFSKNTDGGPGVAVFDSSRPLEGLQTFGFEGAEKLKALYSKLPQQVFHGKEAHKNETTFDDGDLIIIQARENLPHSGGSTALGRLRIALYKAALAEGLLEPDFYHHYLWVTNFPMFTLENGVDPGQGGTAGFSATHHPFTAPKTAEDVDLLRTDPLMAKADHYDLVVNGVELGGGSRRIHSAKMQRFVMQEVLKMNPKRVEDFSHLLKALSAGCPPHAGLAIGFDRLIAVMRGTDSVKDVIAFPKSSKGEDMLVKSPRRIFWYEWKRYHLQKIDMRTENSNEAVEKDEKKGEDENPKETKWMKFWNSVTIRK